MLLPNVRRSEKTVIEDFPAFPHNESLLSIQTLRLIYRGEDEHTAAS